ncbi:hypothetical protein [Candidatus Mycoplasma haematohominis]|uniref:Uncharacterized protein n=1 Tax=Candidatus Mycoplasma haematohominis TaxID=1494318 RepID=A0A478FPY4_9MOLU|nr:hypothetical protein [Candidatus Mycoplasma haemohominis]GCE63578.1 hypothetical protein MHSWG343_05750 [Candidatus Mycoplasma haemohominis]
MSTQAIVGAAAGAVLLGGGGTLAAYAAGAFSNDTYFIKAKREFTEKSYIAEKEEEMKGWLTQQNKETTYKTDLKNNIKKMTGISKTAPTEDKVNKLQGETAPTTAEAKEIYDYAKNWCESKKETVYKGEESEAEFEIFKKVCFVNSPVA